jgi:hypothetical protein
MQCSNHLKQIGIAVHNFHDTQNGVPPISIGSWRASMWVLLYPYMEHTAVYDNHLTTTEVSPPTSMLITGISTRLRRNEWSVSMTEDEIKAFAGPSTYVCPTRRDGSGPFMYTFENGWSGNLRGPQSDYAMVVAYQAVVTAPYTTSFWCWHANTINEHGIKNQFGPFRVAIVPLADGPADDEESHTAYNYKSWQPRDTFAWMSDGTSNQLLIGEKFIPLRRLGPSHDPDNSRGGGQVYTADTTYIMSGSWKVGAARALQTEVDSDGPNGFPLARPGEFEGTSASWSDPNPVNDYGFGSSHPGICNFCLGDASVRAISVTTPTRTLARLSNCIDGIPTTVP